MEEFSALPRCGIRAFCFLFYWKLVAVVVCSVNGCGVGGKVSCGVLRGEEGSLLCGVNSVFFEYGVASPVG
jgi:hypothetical protein